MRAGSRRVQWTRIRGGVGTSSRRGSSEGHLRKRREGERKDISETSGSRAPGPEVVGRGENAVLPGFEAVYETEILNLVVVHGVRPGIKTTGRDFRYKPPTGSDYPCTCQSFREVSRSGSIYQEL